MVRWLMLCWMLCLAGTALARELVVVVKVQVVPNAVGPVRGGNFQMRLGEMLAAAMGREARFLVLPRNRMTAALESGEGDILCGYVPEWLPGAFDWSRPFLPAEDVVVSTPRVPPLRSIDELKGKRIGTVLGFRYPEFERRLGEDFVRDDAPSESVSLQKLLAGRFEYVIATRATVDSQIQHGYLPSTTQILILKDFKTQCAVSRKGGVTVGEVNAAIVRSERGGELDKLLRAHQAR